MALDREADEAKDTARLALFQAITKTANELSKHGGDNASALKDLAEAYAWLSNTSQPH
ncbi:hypothetical protein ACWEQH_07560 [Streptomyces sp. NPDC004166]